MFGVRWKGSWCTRVALSPPWLHPPHPCSRRALAARRVVCTLYPGPSRRCLLMGPPPIRLSPALSFCNDLASPTWVFPQLALLSLWESEILISLSLFPSCFSKTGQIWQTFRPVSPLCVLFEYVGRAGDLKQTSQQTNTNRAFPWLPF